MAAGAIEPRVARAPAYGSSQPAAAVTPAPGQECPSGTVKLRTPYADSFEGSFATPMVNSGWSFHPTATAAAGRQTLRSEMTWTGRDDQYAQIALASPLQVADGRTYVTFAARGTYAAGSAVIYANDDSWALGRAPNAATFSRFRLDLTDTVSVGGASSLSLSFVNIPAFAENKVRQSLEIDDVQVYQCSATASRVSGDYNGDGFTDIIAVDVAGLLWLWRGTGDGRVDPVAIVAGTGWSGMTWIASVGDLDGDGRAELMARDTAGNLWAYIGDGVRSFSRRVLIGTGWQGMVQIVPVGDMTGDGVPELLGLNATGDLFRYTVRPGPRITDRALIGVQFYDFRRLLSTGDYNGDDAPDVLAVDKDATMWGYWTRPGAGTLSPRGTKLGEGWAMTSVSSPGDFDRNGFNDVLAVGPRADLVVYFVKDGHWAGTELTRPGWRYRLTG